MATSVDRRDITELGPWFHNLHLPGGLETCLEHWAGDFPRWKWLEFESRVPQDLTGWRALDVGCNAGFYSFELGRRGAAVLGIDIDAHYLARPAGPPGVLTCRTSASPTARSGTSDLAERADLILFLGVFYHLRYPMLALDLRARLRPRLIVFQTLTQGSGEVSTQAPEDCDFATASPSPRRTGHISRSSKLLSAATRPAGGCRTGQGSWACCEPPDSTSSIIPAT